jgi:hypothetical protein
MVDHSSDDDKHVGLQSLTFGAAIAYATPSAIDDARGGDPEVRDSRFMAATSALLLRLSQT